MSAPAGRKSYPPYDPSEYQNENTFWYCPTCGEGCRDRVDPACYNPDCVGGSIPRLCVNGKATDIHYKPSYKPYQCAFFICERCGETKLDSKDRGKTLYDSYGNIHRCSDKKTDILEEEELEPAPNRNLLKAPVETEDPISPEDFGRLLKYLEDVVEFGDYTIEGVGSRADLRNLIESHYTKAYKLIMEE